jgi:hypothetical protein
MKTVAILTLQCLSQSYKSILDPGATEAETMFDYFASSTETGSLSIMFHIANRSKQIRGRSIPEKLEHHQILLICQMILTAIKNMMQVNSSAISTLHK